MVQPGLARTLRRLASGGAEAFYRGELAAELSAALEAGGSPLRAEDFAEHRADWQLPLTSCYRGQTTYQVGPNTQGLTALQILNIVDGWDLSSFGPESTPLTTTIWPRPPARPSSIASSSATPTSSTCQSSACSRRARRCSPRRHRSEPGRAATLEKIGGDTIYLAAADDEGNLISLIQSVYWDFGSGFVAGESGVIIQNRGSFFSLDPTHPNVLAPGKRTFHTLIPAMYGQPDRPWLAYGNMGGEGQPQSQAAVLTGSSTSATTSRPPSRRHAGYSAGPGAPTAAHSTSTTASPPPASRRSGVWGTRSTSCPIGANSLATPRRLPSTASAVSCSALPTRAATAPRWVSSRHRAVTSLTSLRRSGTTSGTAPRRVRGLQV